MTAAVSYAVVNQSTTTDPAMGGELTAPVLAQIAAAIELQLNTHVADEWGGASAVRVAKSDGSDLGPLEVPVYIQDSSTVQGAAGYHDRTPAGMPIIYVFRDGSNSLTTGGQALSVTMSHELIEAKIDPGANRWADGTDGFQYALEGCDAFESFFYSVDDVAVSDFTLQAFFSPGAAGPYSHLGNGTAPLTTAAAAGGDYQIVRTASGDEHPVTARGHVPAHKLGKKKHPSSRSYRRGARL